MSDVLVVGRITAVEPGLGFRDKYQEEPLPPDAQVVGDGVVVDFDDPAAQWRTMTLTVEVTEVFGGALDERQIRVGFGAPSLPFEKTRTAFLALGRVALPLFAHSAVYAYDDSLWAVTEDGNLLAVVADDGSLALPFALEHSDVALLANVRTIAELRTAALRARVVKPDPSLRELQP